MSISIAYGAPTFQKAPQHFTGRPPPISPPNPGKAAVSPIAQGVREEACRGHTTMRHSETCFDLGNVWLPSLCSFPSPSPSAGTPSGAWPLGQCLCLQEGLSLRLSHWSMCHRKQTSVRGPTPQRMVSSTLSFPAGSTEWSSDLYKATQQARKSQKLCLTLLSPISKQPWRGSPATLRLCQES